MKIRHPVSLAGCVAAAAFCIGATPGGTQAQVTLSATGGFNFASIQIHENKTVGLEASGLRRYSGGVRLAIPIADRFLFRVDGGYAERGAHFNFQMPAGPVELSVKMGHLEMASLIGMRLGGSGAGAYMLVGPSAAYLTECRQRRVIPGIGLDTESSCLFQLARWQNRDFDFGAVGVAGFEVGLAPLAVSIEGLYYLGIYDFAQAADETMKHRGISVRAGVGIPFG